MKTWALVMGIGVGIAPASQAFAETFSKACADLPACVKAVSELTGDRYIYDKDLKGGVDGSPNVELTKESASRLLSLALDLNGFTRVPVGDKEFRIQRQRDARDTLLPVFEGSETAEPAWPDNFDAGSLHYVLKHPESAEEIARTLRSFMPANSRIIPSVLSGSELITASTPEMKNAFHYLRMLDRPLPPGYVPHWQREEHRPPPASPVTQAPPTAPGEGAGKPPEQR